MVTIGFLSAIFYISSQSIIWIAFLEIVSKIVLAESPAKFCKFSKKKTDI